MIRCKSNGSLLLLVEKSFSDEQKKDQGKTGFLTVAHRPKQRIFFTYTLSSLSRRRASASEMLPSLLQSAA